LFANLSHSYLNYSKQWNTLDYPATILPVTTADKITDRLDISYKPINELDDLTYRAYDPDLYDGAPVSVQLVGRSLTEEELLAVTEAVDRALCQK
jgi:amidase